MAGIKSRLSLLPSVLLCRDSPSPRSLDLSQSYMASPLRCSFHRALLIFFFFFFLRFPDLQSRHPFYLR